LSLKKLQGELLHKIHLKEGLSASNGVVLHSDNGSLMKGATMLATMQKLGVVPSFSRPSVSNDNAYSESLFKTMKYSPTYPDQPFCDLLAASEVSITQPTERETGGGRGEKGSMMLHRDVSTSLTPTDI
jgi:transposase InsO family protein